MIEVGKPWQEQVPQALPPMSDPKAWFWVRSCSSDGRKLAGWQQRAAGPAGVVIYSLASRHYEKLTDFGSFPVWLSDNRRLLFNDATGVLQGNLYLVDSQSKKVQKVLSLAPDSIGSLAVSKDDRLIYFILRSTEADIWLMTLE